jgi:hypothetical protein
MLAKIKNIQDQVKILLENHPKCRDNDNRLFMTLLHNFDKELIEGGFEDFAKKFVQGVYPAMESVTRARRKVQEENPNLRGKSYVNRQFAEADVRKGING